MNPVPNMGALRIIGSKTIPLSRLGSKHAKSFSTSIYLSQKSQSESQVDGRKLTPQEAKVEAAKLAMDSLKDVGSLLSSGNDDAMQPIDTAPIFTNHSLFGSLNVIHQGQVVKELQDKYDKKWTKMTENEKKLGYYIAYGDWGVREKFKRWNMLEAPWDLPFTVPSQVRTSNPKPTDKVRKLEPVFLAETEVRKSQFEMNKMDPMTKTFIYITVFVVIFALIRDKKIGEEGKPVEYISVDQYAQQKEEERKRLEKLREEELAKARARKWYYLWLK